MNLATEWPITCLISRGDILDANYDEMSEQLIDIARRAAKCNISFIQIREKELSARRLSDLALEILDAVAVSTTRVLINDRADIALATGCHGVHLTSRSMPCEVVRRIVGSEFVIGVSTHTAEDVRRARAGGADYALFGPVFSTPGKGTPVGITELREVCAENGEFPVLALGGIEPENYRSVLDAGAAGFAAIRSMNDEIFLSEVVAKL